MAAFDAHKNFAYSTVATAPSPATSGTSLVVATGDGSKFPTVPFNAVVWPASTQPTTSNAEIVRVTAISTDTLTITRTQESTSARTIIVGDQIAANITNKTLTDIENNIAGTYTLEESLTLGNPVGISNLKDNKIARANRSASSVAHGITSPLADAPTQRLYAPIGGDKYVRLEYTAAASDTLFAQVVSVDRTTMTQTMGTAASVATAVTPGTNLVAATVCKLDTDKFIVFYLADASTTAIQYRIGTVSGTTITFGTAATAFTAASTVATTAAFTADYISTDKGVFVFKAATTTSSKVIVFTASGTVATFGTAASPDANSVANVVTFVKTIGTDKFVIATYVSTTSIYAQVGTCIGGTTITLGTEVQMSTTTTQSMRGLISPATDVFVIGMNVDTTNLAMVAGTVSTRTITAGTTVSKTIALGASSGHGCLWATDASTLYYAVSSNPTTSNNGDTWKATLSGTTITDAGLLGSRIYGMYPDCAIRMDNGYTVIATTNVTTSGSVDGTNHTIWIEGMSNNFIGFIQATAARAATAVVLLDGVDTNQSSLIAGANYLVSNGALTNVSPIVTVNSLDDIDVVKALSATTVRF